MAEWQKFTLWVRRLANIALIGWLCLLTFVDLAVAVSTSENQLNGLLGSVVGVVAVLYRRRYPVAATWVAVAVSILVSAFLVNRGYPCLGETGALLIMTITVARVVYPLRNAVIMIIATAAALLAAVGVRVADNYDIVLGFVVFVAWVVAAAIGAYQRYHEERRLDSVEAVRRAERLELARELHDLVAHHITGIVVQAQAARVVAEQRPEATLPALDAIAGAGGEALTAMRRLVGVLRSEDEAARRPGTSLADLRILVERFAATGPLVAFDVGPGISEADLAPEVLTTLHRVLQESLTNVRRHAHTATWVEADLRLVDHGLRLRVCNYGSAVPHKVSRLGGGFGLVGMAERVEALGGVLSAGPNGTGVWEVCAFFPLRPVG
ncbi:sensor histidine kinase [Rhizohabitans arisaemae]|uniref:sensor histidine kinase n=1 Tax=Rhizohabitans arisaemae TaxID=2720610 RepID=UPI0024B16891|nr:histidine kinase [Rhizohabitans arisaemae]